MECPDLTIDDFNDKLTMEGNRLDVLAVVAEKALEKFREHAAAEAQAKPNARRRTKRGRGEVSTTSTASKRRKSNSAPPPLPEEFANVIQEIARGKALTPATLVIEKSLFSTDVNPGQNRLSIPVSQVVRDDFLTDDEKRLLQSYIDADTETKKKGKKKKYIKVKMIEPSLKLETVKFCQWDMEKANGGKTTCNYVINGKWSHIVTRNNLTKHTRVQLWCFRVDQELCFALVRLPPS